MEKSIKKTPAIVIIASLVIVLAGMKYASSLVSPILLAIFISIILTQPVHWLEKKKVPLWLAMVIVLLISFGVFFGMGQIIGRSFSSFSENAPLYAEKLNTMSLSVIHFLQEQGLNITKQQLGEVLQPGKIMNTTASLLTQLGSLVGNTFLVFFIIIFILTESHSFGLKTKVIMGKEEHSMDFIQTILHNIRDYLTIKSITSLMTGILIWVGLWILGVDYAIVWGLIAFMLNYIPTIGSIVAGVPAVLLALVQLGFGGAVWALGIFLAVNITIGSVVEPKMMGKGMGLSTLIVFLSLIFWGYIFGTIGMFLSVPMTMALKIILEQNDHTRWISVFLGSHHEAKQLLQEDDTKKTGS